MGPAVYVQTNDAAENEIVAFGRVEDGTLAPIGRYATGGRGTGEPHLASQGSVVLSEDGRWLLVVNAGSDELSLFEIEPDGLRLADRVSTGGIRPTSAAVSGALVYVLNNGTPTITGFNLVDGKLSALADSTRPLSGSDADPAQISFAPGGGGADCDRARNQQHQQLCDRRARLRGRSDDDQVLGSDAVRFRLRQRVGGGDRGVWWRNRGRSCFFVRRD
jgi:hypothetical protein